MQYLYKFLRTGLKSEFDGSKWTIGKWRKEKAPQEECKGLNASEYIQDALKYVCGEILAVVECGGKIIKSTNKWTCQEMCIVKRYSWTKEDSIKLAIYCAELVLPIFEKKYPNDNRPKEAIRAAKRYLKNPNKKNEATASHAAHVAYATACASCASACAADAAARAARAACAACASDAADDAARAAHDASCAAAYVTTCAKTKKKIHDYIIKMKRIKI